VLDAQERPLLDARLSEVPEPAGFGLLLSGLGVMGLGAASVRVAKNCYFFFSGKKTKVMASSDSPGGATEVASTIGIAPTKLGLRPKRSTR